ncbi:MAG TPA: hypothetical protein VNV44_07965 [Solirubrobacteraceae bacterium]|jgi:hypothetical protein|nr:hypothetical protein [Solirubrobacteraceae bacterium]
MPLLYVDLLGMKSRYRARGVNAARSGQRQLRAVVLAGLSALPAGVEVSGGIQSDAAALQFRHPTDALTVGQAMMIEAFRRSSREQRVWIRGAIMKRGGPRSRLDTEVQLEGAPAGVLERQFRPVLMEAIHVEQAGFRGHRLLISTDLIDDDLQAAHLRHRYSGADIAPFRRLRYSHYPSPVCDGFCDFLWMIPTTLSSWDRRKRRMLDLLRWSGDGGDDEVRQAAATHLVFAEADAMLHADG